MMLIESRPNDIELEELKAKYGEPVVRKMDRTDLQELFLPPKAYKNCRGEGVGLIFDNNNEILLVKKTKENSWFFPSGRIWEQESVEEGTIREVYEETGLKIKLGSMPSIHIVDLHFKNCTLRLWHFIFVAKKYTGRLKVRDSLEIGECRFFADPPSNNREFEKAWIEIALEDV